MYEAEEQPPQSKTTNMRGVSDASDTALANKLLEEKDELVESGHKDDEPLRENRDRYDKEK